MNEAFLVYRKVESYLARETSLSELNRWLASLLPQLLQLPPNDPHRGLASEVVFRFAQMDEGLLDENKFSQIIRDYLASNPPVIISTGQSGGDLYLETADTEWEPVGKAELEALKSGT